MSLRFSAANQYIRRLTNLPASASAFTIVVFAKLATAHPTYRSTIAFLADTGTAEAHLAVLDNPSTGLDLKAINHWTTDISAVAASVTAGGSSGVNWFGMAMAGTASGANGLKIYHRPVGVGSLSVQSVTNSNFGGLAPAEMWFGDNPATAPGGGFDEFWFDGHIAHVKVWNAALSQAEIDLELQYAVPQRTANLLSYHPFAAGSLLATALVPTQGTGTYSAPDQQPAIDSDDPPVPVTAGVRVSWAEMDVPAVTSSVDASSVASRKTVGQPTVSQVGGVGSVTVTFVEMEIPPPGAAVQPTSVASRKTVGSPEVQNSLLATSVSSRHTVGQPSLSAGGLTQPSSVESRAVVGQPALGLQGEINGAGIIVTDFSETANVLSVSSRRTVGQPTIGIVLTSTLTSVGSRRTVGSPALNEGQQINLGAYSVLSRASVGRPEVTGVGGIYTAAPQSVASPRAVGRPTVDQSSVFPFQVIEPASVPSRKRLPGPAVSQVGGVSTYDGGSGGADADDDDDTVGPHKVPYALRRRKKRTEEEAAAAAAAAKAPAAAEPAAEPAEVAAFTAAAAPFPRSTDQGVLVTPAMLQQIKDDAIKAAKLAFEIRNRKEGRLVTAAREHVAQKAQQRLERLADLAIEAAEEAEYEPAERDQVKEVEMVDPVTGQTIKATIKSKIAA